MKNYSPASMNKYPRPSDTLLGCVKTNDMGVFLFQFSLLTLFRNPLDTIGPELDTLVRCVLWRFSVLDQGGSIGQSLLGIKFSTSSSRRLWILAATDIISNYLTQRQSLVIKSLPGREETKFYIQHKLSILLSTGLIQTV